MLKELFLESKTIWQNFEIQNDEKSLTYNDGHDHSDTEWHGEKMIWRGKQEQQF